MNIRRVKTFLLAVKHKNFSHVADILNISQPAVSKQIKTLEQELGTPLLYRESLEPTEAGRILLQQGPQLLQIWDTITQQCAALQGNVTGLITIGASSIPGTYFLPPVLQRFWEQFPRVEVRVAIHESEHIMQLVEEEKVDLGLVGSDPLRHEGLQSHVLARDKLVLIGSREAEEIEQFADIKDKPFIFRSEHSGTWQAAERGLNHWGYSTRDLKYVAKVEHTESVLAMVEQGLGYSFVSHLAAQRASDMGRIKILAELPVVRAFYAVYLRSKPLNTGLTNLIHLAFLDVDD